MARLARGIRTPALAAAFRPAASFCKGQATPAKAALEVPAEDLEAEHRRLILAAQAHRDCRAPDRVVPAGRPLHFGVLEEAGRDREDAARRRKASRAFMVCNACCARESIACGRASMTSMAIPSLTRARIR